MSGPPDYSLNPFLTPRRPVPTDPVAAAVQRVFDDPTSNAFGPTSGTDHLLTPREHAALAAAPRLPTGDRGVPAWISNPTPITHDFRGDDPSDRRVDLAGFRPGDELWTNGADIRIEPNGAPRVTLRPGYENGRSAGREGPVLVPPAPPGVSVDDNMRLAAQHTPFWLREVVPNRGPWDYKQRGHRYEAFGNFNFGAAARSENIPDGFVLREAGRAQVRDGTTDPRFGAPGPRLFPFAATKSYGDDPVDQHWIEQGGRYADQVRRAAKSGFPTAAVPF